MDAVIERFKPRSRFAAPPPMPHAWAAAGSPARPVSPSRLVTAGSRIVLVAPHPDDEVLALGGTLAALAGLGHELLVVAVTDGEGSHPDSSRWTRDALRSVRPQESLEALHRLGLAPDMLRLGLPDGAVAEHEKSLAEQLPLGSRDTVLVPWRHDGHADHEACARAALAACRTVGARCIEFPVWALVPSHAAHARLRHSRLQRVVVPQPLVQAKRRAIEAFSSQLLADGDTPAVLREDALATWTGTDEWVMA